MSALDAPALARLWDAAAERLQRNGLRAAGIITLDGLAREERHALSGLIGRHLVGDRARVDMAALDERLRSTGSALGLVAAVEARRGPLVDRKGERAAAVERRSALWAAAREELATQGLIGQPWVEAWLESIRTVIGRVPPLRAETVLRTAVRGVARLPWSAGPRIGRTEFASALGGSSHALDDGSVLGALV
ncbi:MAG: TIGR02679 domain-containing protein, partial [Candidatus Dormibacteraceae bacterium]